MTELTAIEALLHREIPLSREMGAHVLVASRDLARIEAPLTPNINYSGTGFGGSLYSAAVLACWLLVRTTIEAEGLEMETLVIQSGAMEYLTPVTSGFEGEARWPSDEARMRFLDGLKRRRIFRTEIAGQVTCEGAVCATLVGRFVARIRAAS